jgi:hypothetical protein
MTSPTPAPRGLSYPTRTKVIIAAVLAVAIAAIVLAYLSTAQGTDDGVAVTGADGLQDQGPAGGAPNGVERTFPRDGDEILGQERIGIDLAPSWTGELVLVAEGGEALTLPEDELERNELNQILYQPGPGRAVERLSGDYCLSATIWDQVRGRDASQRVETWCFSAT